jgi:hypothetical protein
MQKTRNKKSSLSRDKDETTLVTYLNKHSLPSFLGSTFVQAMRLPS